MPESVPVDLAQQILKAFGDPMEANGPCWQWVLWIGFEALSLVKFFYKIRVFISDVFV